MTKDEFIHQVKKMWFDHTNPDGDGLMIIAPNTKENACSLHAFMMSDEELGYCAEAAIRKAYEVIGKHFLNVVKELISFIEKGEKGENIFH